MMRYVCPPELARAGRELWRISMAVKRSRSRGVRPVRDAWLWGLGTVVGILLILKGVADTRETDRSGSPYLMLGLFPALLSPIALIYHALKIPVVRGMRRGTTAIARWTISADEYRLFVKADAQVEAESRFANFYEPLRSIPANGVEVIFASDGVLIGDGYFPLSTTSGRRVRSVRIVNSTPSMIEFGTMLETRARTSSVTTAAVRTSETIRVPVASNAAREADKVLRQFSAALVN